MKRYRRLAEVVSGTSRAFVNLIRLRSRLENNSFSNDSAANGIALNWDPLFLPSFQYKVTTLESRQKEIFDVINLGEVFAELLIGIESLGAYYILDKEGYYQFANFAAYTSAFHLIDSFLCLKGIHYIPTPTGGAHWETFRLVNKPPFRGVPIKKLEPERLKDPKNAPVNYLVAAWDSTRTDWRLSEANFRSVHTTRWRAFGQLLLQMMQQGSLFSIPKEVRQFFGYFGGHLAYRGVRNVTNTTVTGLTELIKVACLGYTQFGTTKPALVPIIRSISIYRNRAVDDYMRLVGQYINPRIMGPPSRIVGVHFRRLVQGLARTQVSEVNDLIDQVRTTLSNDLAAFHNGLETSLLFSGLTELDIRKLEATDIFKRFHTDLLDLVYDYFGKVRYLGISQTFKRWNVGTQSRPDMHTLRPPVTWDSCFTPNTGWFPP